MPKHFHTRTIILSAILFATVYCNAQWTKTGGPPGMNVNGFYKAGNTLYAGTSRGVFSSADNGVTWQASNSGIENNTVYALISDGTFLYAGTDNGVFRSTNGISWSAANSGIENIFVKSFYIANGFLYAGSIGQGLFKTSTRGNSWSDASGGALNSSIIYAITYSAPHLVVVADNLIFYSDDNGNSWFIPQNSPFILTGVPSFLTRGDSIIVTAGFGIYRSFNGGVSWGNLITVNNNISICGIVQANGVAIVGSKTGMYFSRNFGTSWIPVASQGLRQGNWFTNAFYLSGNNFLIAYDEIGVGYSSDRGADWNYTLSGFTPAATIDDALSATGNIVMSGTHGDGIYQSNDGGATWLKTGTINDLDTLSNSNIFSLLKLSNAILLAGTCGNGLYRSSNGGVTWTRIRNGLPQQQSGFLCVNSLARTTSNVLIGTDQGLYYSSDLGLSWHGTNISGTGFTIMGVAANGAVACAASEGFIGTNKIFRSTDNGVTWNIAFETSIAEWATMASDGNNHFYAGTLNSSNLVSNNNGISWQNMGPGIPPGDGGFTISAFNSNVFVGNISGLYYSNNFGASFTQQNTGFDPSPNNSVQGLAVSATHIYAGLFKNSVWKRPLSDFGIVSVITARSSEIKATITPNPLTSISILTYKVESNANVLINMYDQRGMLIKNLVNTTQNVGDYQARITKNNLHEGNYFINIIIGNKHQLIPVAVK